MDCCFSCFYCFEKDNHKKTYITDDVISNIVKYIKKRKNLQSISLTWFGGEPLMAIDKMQEFYHKLRKVWKGRFSSNVITTAFHIDEQTIEILKEIEVTSMQISIDGNDEIYLCSINAKADAINNQKLKELTTKEIPFSAIMSGSYTKPNKSDFPAPKDLILKIGAKIMMLKNDTNGKYVNGSLGTIVNLDANKIVVNMKGIDYDINREKWEDFEYTYHKGKKKLDKMPIGTFEQFPIQLAWAITIHKSQGKTFDNIIIDLDNGAFATGQTYVALSRCRTLNGIKLTQPITPPNILVDNQVINFTKKQVAKNKKAVREKIKTAIQKQSSVKIFYIKENGQQSQRTISNIHYSDSKNKKIGAYCHLRNEQRPFVIDRIKRIYI